jgi:hypothetical protein
VLISRSMSDDRPSTKVPSRVRSPLICCQVQAMTSTLCDRAGTNARSDQEETPGIYSAWKEPSNYNQRNVHRDNNTASLKVMACGSSLAEQWFWFRVLVDIIRSHRCQYLWSQYRSRWREAQPRFESLQWCTIHIKGTRCNDHLGSGSSLLGRRARFPRTLLAC